jgi:hypothetical protein
VIGSQVRLKVLPDLAFEEDDTERTAERIETLLREVLQGDRGAPAPRENQGERGAPAPRENQGERGAPAPRENQGDRGAPAPRENQGERGAPAPRGTDTGERG